MTGVNFLSTKAFTPIEQRKPIKIEAEKPSPLANLGLTAFFFLATRRPWLVERLKPLFIRIAWHASPAVRRATAANAKALFNASRSLRYPEEPGILSHRRYALAVLGRFYDVVVDIARSSSLTRADLLAQIESIDGKEGYRATRANGRGAIVLTAHAGSFEVGLAALSELEPHIHVVFKRDAFARFESARQRLRLLLNVTESPVDNGPGIWMNLRDALRLKHVVAVQGDRTPPGQKGIPMPIRLGTLLLPTGPFKLALASGAPVVPIFSARTPSGKVALFIKPAIEVHDSPDAIPQAVAAYARELDTFLTDHADQWLVLEPAFIETPPSPLP